MTISITTGGPISSVSDTSLTIIQIINNVCKTISISPPVSLIGNTDDTASKLLNTLVKSCEEVARRVDWGTLKFTTEFAGTGNSGSYDLPLDFSRFINGAAVRNVGGDAIRGGLSSSEWNALPEKNGTPRFFHLGGKAIKFWPNLAPENSVKVWYQGKYFTGAGKDVFESDDDTILLPHEVLEKAVIYRWKRDTKQEYEDFEAEYEAAIADYSGFDVQDRTP